MKSIEKITGKFKFYMYFKIQVSSLAPRRRGLCIVRDGVFLTSSLTHSVAPPFQIEPASLGFDFGYIFWRKVP